MCDANLSTQTLDVELKWHDRRSFCPEASRIGDTERGAANKTAREELDAHTRSPGISGS
jgi:hypothetical protein